MNTATTQQTALREARTIVVDTANVVGALRSMFLNGQMDESVYVRIALQALAGHPEAGGDLDPISEARREIAATIEGDSDNPLRVAEANAILRGERDADYGLDLPDTPAAATPLQQAGASSGEFLTSDPSLVDCTAQAVLAMTIMGVSNNLPEDHPASDWLFDNSESIAGTALRAMGIPGSARGVLKTGQAALATPVPVDAGGGLIRRAIRDFAAEQDDSDADISPLQYILNREDLLAAKIAAALASPPVAGDREAATGGELDADHRRLSMARAQLAIARIIDPQAEYIATQNERPGRWRKALAKAGAIQALGTNERGGR